MVSEGSGPYSKINVLFAGQPLTDRITFCSTETRESYMKLHSSSPKAPRKPNLSLKWFQVLGTSGNGC